MRFYFILFFSVLTSFLFSAGSSLGGRFDRNMIATLPRREKHKKAYAVIETMDREVTKTPITVETVEEMAHKIGELMTGEPRKPAHEQVLARKKRNAAKKATLEDQEAEMSPLLDPLQNSGNRKLNFHLRSKRDQEG